MPQLAFFTEAADGFFGRIHTFARIAVKSTSCPPSHPDTENAPDYRVHLRHAGGMDVRRRSARAGDLYRRGGLAPSSR